MRNRFARMQDREARAVGVPQRRGGTKYTVGPSRHCLIIRCGGLDAASGALVAGQLQPPLNPSRTANGLFDLYCRELFPCFRQVRI